MTTDDSYPEAWRPAWAPPFESPPEPESKSEPLAMELHAAAMDDEQWAEFTKRIGRS